jgi:hypothetical protein
MLDIISSIIRIKIWYRGCNYIILYYHPGVVDIFGEKEWMMSIPKQTWFKESPSTPWSQTFWDLGPASEFSLITCWMVALTRLMQLPGLDMKSIPKSWGLVGTSGRLT